MGEAVGGGRQWAVGGGRWALVEPGLQSRRHRVPQQRRSPVLPPQMRRPVVDRDGPPEIRIPPPAAAKRDRLYPRAPCGLDVVRRVTDHDSLRRRAPQVVERRLDDVRVGLRLLGVTRRRPPLDETLDAGAPKQPLEFFLARGAGDSERVPLADQVRDQFLRAGQPLHGGKVALPEDLAATFSEALPFGRVLFNSHELG